MCPRQSGRGSARSHALVVQAALPATLTAPDRRLDRVLRLGDQAARAHYAGTFSRRFWMSSLAFLTALEASAEYPSAPTASAYSWVTGAPPTITMTSSRMPAFSSALMLALNIGIVVVRNAEKRTRR